MKKKKLKRITNSVITFLSIKACISLISFLCINDFMNDVYFISFVTYWICLCLISVFFVFRVYIEVNKL